jgi:integrase
VPKRGKRGNREGTIMKRVDGRWHGRLTISDGKRKHICGKTRQEVARHMVEIQHEIDSGLPILDERQTVGQFLETWIEIAKSQIRGSSWRRYGDYVRVHLMPDLGRTALTHLSPQHIQLFYARKLNQGSLPQLFITSMACYIVRSRMRCSWDSSSGMSWSWYGRRAEAPER